MISDHDFWCHALYLKTSIQHINLCLGLIASHLRIAAALLFGKSIGFVACAAKKASVLQGSIFDFGMNDTRINPVAVGLGSGIPCGVNPRAG